MKTININGTEYIKTDEIKKNYIRKDEIEKNYLKKDELKKIRNKVDELSKIVTEDRPRGKRKASNEIFKPSKVTQRIINIKQVLPNGNIITSQGHISKYTLNDVKYLSKKLNNKTTYGDIRKYANKMEISYEMCRVLAYNIREGTFDEYL